MTETPDLDTLLGIGTPMSPARIYDEKAKRLLAVREQIKALKEEETAITDSIWTLTPDEPGEFSIDDGEQYSFSVSRTELWKWDSKKLEVLASKNPIVGGAVKSTFSLDKKEHPSLLSVLEPHYIKELDAALTRKPGAPRVKVRRKS